MVNPNTNACWKLVLRYKTEGGCLKNDSYSEPFEGSFNQMRSYMEEINSKNYSYKIVDFFLITVK